MNLVILKNRAQELFLIYKQYMGKGFGIFNEIILHFLSELPDVYSDKIIEYLCSDFEINIFEKSSGNGNQLQYTKLIIKLHSVNCSEDNFRLLEKTIVNYKLPIIYEKYKRLVEYCKKIRLMFTGVFEVNYSMNY